MSSTEIYAFDLNGNAEQYGEAKNAFRGAMAIWGILEEKYLPPYLPKGHESLGIYTVKEYEKRLGYKPSRMTAMFDTDAMNDVWKLADDEKVEFNDKIVLFTTFDNVVVKKEDINKVIEAFKKFEGETSLKEQAAILEEIMNNNDYTAVAWNQTSVNEAKWEGHYDDDDNHIPYNHLTQDEHYYLFDELKC